MVNNKLFGIFGFFVAVFLLDFVSADAGTGSWFGHPIFSDFILPFLLVFVVIFAILQKSKILGDGKMQIDALVSLAVGLILIGVPAAREIVVSIIPWLAVGVVVILMFLILYGFVAGDKWKDHKWIVVVFGILIGIFVIGVVIVTTGFLPTIQSWFSGSNSEGFWMNVLFLCIISGAIVAVIVGAKKSNDDSDKE